MTVRACHDGTAFADFLCACGAWHHVHESQLAGASADDDVGCICRSCGNLAVLPRDEVEAALVVSRERLAR